MRIEQYCVTNSNKQHVCRDFFLHVEGSLCPWISTGPGIMEGVATLVPEFTDYSKWERRPSNKSGTSAGWSVGKDRGKGRRKQIQSRQQDALSLAARLSQASVLVDRSPEHTQRHCHSSSKKVSCISPPPRLVRHSTKSPERTIPKEKSAKHSILQMQLDVRRKSIKEFTEYRSDLLAANLKLIGIIRQDEDQKNLAVQELLDKYRKSRGSVAALKKKTLRDKVELQAELDRTKQWVLKKEKDLREEVHEAEMLLQAKIKERDVLKGFKEKEYMVNQVAIERLREEIRQHTQHSEERITAVEAEIAEERDKCQRMMDEKRREIEAWATERFISKMKRSVKEKGIQNKIMEKEIAIHSCKAEALKQSVHNLRTQIGHMKVMLQEQRARMNPLMHVEKCLPDTELCLSIPIQKPHSIPTQ